VPYRTDRHARQPDKRAALQTIGAIQKGHSSQLRVLISEWRGQRKVELRDYTAVIADVYFAGGAGVTLDIEAGDTASFTPRRTPRRTPRPEGEMK
jgi:hypothetical protein